MRKHAQADSVYVVVEFTPASGVLVQVQPAAYARHDSVGPTSVRPRVTALGGTLEVSRGHHNNDTGFMKVINTEPQPRG